MSFSPIARLYIGCLTAILLVILIGVLSLSLFQQQSQTGSMVRHTYQVLNRSEVIQRLLADMEIERNGFQRTGSRRSLQAYDRAAQEVQLTIDELKKLVSDNPSQLKRIYRLESLIKTWLNF